MTLIALALVCASTLSAKPQSNTDVQSKIKTFRNAKRYRYEYDRFKDRTHVRCLGFAVKVRNTGSGIQRVIVSTDLFFAGKDPHSSEAHFYLTFEAYGANWQLLKNKNLLAIVDGTRKDFGQGLHDSEITSGLYTGSVGVDERLTFQFSAEDLQSLARAKTVEFQISDLDLSLEDEHQQAWRDLLGLVK